MNRNGVVLKWGNAVPIALLGAALTVSACTPVTPGNVNGNENTSTNVNTNSDGMGCVTGEPIGQTTVSFNDDILPILNTAGCMTSACHGGLSPQNGFDLTTYESMFVPGDSASALGECPIVPGDPDTSFLYEKISESQPRVGEQMPQDREPLTDEEIELIRTWIEEGAADN